MLILLVAIIIRCANTQINFKKHDLYTIFENEPNENQNIIQPECSKNILPNENTYKKICTMKNYDQIQNESSNDFLSNSKSKINPVYRTDIKFNMNDSKPTDQQNEECYLEKGIGFNVPKNNLVISKNILSKRNDKQYGCNKDSSFISTEYSCRVLTEYGTSDITTPEKRVNSYADYKRRPKQIKREKIPISSLDFLAYNALKEYENSLDEPFGTENVKNFRKNFYEESQIWLKPAYARYTNFDLFLIKIFAIPVNFIVGIFSKIDDLCRNYLNKT